MAVAVIRALKALVIPADPVVGATPRIGARINERLVVTTPKRRHAQTERRCGVGDVQVEQYARGSRQREHTLGHRARKSTRHRPLTLVAGLHPQAHRQRRDANTRGLARSGDRPRVVHIGGEVRACVDTGHHEVGPHRQQLVHSQIDTVGWRAADVPSPLPAGRHPNGVAHRQRVGLGRLLQLRRDGPQRAQPRERGLKHAQTGSVVAVIVGKQDVHGRHVQGQPSSRACYQESAVPARAQERSEAKHHARPQSPNHPF